MSKLAWAFFVWELNMFKEISKFPKPVWVLIIVSFVRVVAYFTAIPYLAIVLDNVFKLNAAEIGLLLGASAAVGILISFVFGNLSDQFGRRKVILLGYLLGIMAMAFIGFAQHVGFIIIGIVLLNIGTGIMNAPSQALLTDYVRDDRAQRDLAIQVKYFALNLGVVIGPLVGLQLAAGSQMGFVYLIGVYIVMFGFLAQIFRNEAPNNAALNPDNHNTNLWHAIKVVKSDHIFLYFVFLMLLILTVFAQLEVTLILDISAMFDELNTQFEKPQQIYAYLMSLAGLTVVVSQLPLIKLTKNISMLNRALIGSVIFMFGFGLLGFMQVLPFGYFYNLALAMVVITIGEVVLFPTLNMIQDRMAPEHLKGSYFGVGSLSEFGYAIAPMFGGYILLHFGSQILWFIVAAMCAFISVNFWFLKNKSEL